MFFSEITDSNTIALFSTSEDIEPYKAYLSNLGGTFVRELESKKSSKLPAWIFDAAKKADVERFILDQEEDGDKSIQSMPDIEQLFDEIFRRIECLEKNVQEIFEIVDGAH